MAKEETCKYEKETKPANTRGKTKPANTRGETNKIYYTGDCLIYKVTLREWLSSSELSTTVRTKVKVCIKTNKITQTNKITKINKIIKVKNQNFLLIIFQTGITLSSSSWGVNFFCLNKKI